MKKNIVLYVLGVILVIGLVAGGVFFLLNGKNKERKVINATTENYVAYVKINPSVKLNYYQKCTFYSDDTKECEEPTVSSYELVNDDAKELLKDVDLLAGNKDLASVIELICDKVEEKGISTKDVEIQSDWSELNTYLTKGQEEKTTTESETVEEEKVLTHSVTVNVKETETINTTITEEVKAEEKKKAEEAEAKAKAEAEAKAKAEAEAKAKAAQTIYLKDNVSYVIGGRGYCCDNCFTTSLINTLKNAKGYYVTSADASRIDYQKIVRLTGSYNSSKYFGNDLTSKLTQAGAEECGGLGGGEEPLTKEICKQFHLTCE